MLATASEVPILGTLVATGLTLIIQSSSAAIGIIQSLVSTGEITVSGAIPMVLGAKLGTTITAVLAAIASTKAAKRTASVHVLFNVMVVALGLIFLVPFTSMILSIQSATGVDDIMALAFAHIISAVIAVVIFM